MSATPDYWPQALRELARRDAVMRRLIRRYRGEVLRSRGDAFATLARSIVGQQISVKAADTVWNRFCAAVREVTPGAILDTAPQALAGCGLSGRKIEYVVDLAAHFDGGALRPDEWACLGDDDIIAMLMQVRGIGRWTAEMFLIFNLLRPDVLPVDDVGLLRAAGRHYFEGAIPARKRMLELGATWAPWRSAATWYLWRSLDPLLVQY